MECIFCSRIQHHETVMENTYAVAVYDRFPVNKGHMLIIPKRHYASYFESTKEEADAFFDLIQKAKRHLDQTEQPDGYNIGINVGASAGQTIFHVHIHIIPRYVGDVENPRGGIRNFKEALVEYDG